MQNPVRYFKSSPEVIRLVVIMYLRYPLSLRQVEGILFERGIDICHETVRFWWNRFGPMFAAEIRERRIRYRSYSCWRSLLNEVLVRINGDIRNAKMFGIGGCGPPQPNSSSENNHLALSFGGAR